MNKSKEKEKYLYQTETLVTEKEFMRFQKFYLNKFKNNLIPKIGLILLALVALYLNFDKGNYDIVITVIIFIILYPILFNLSINHQIKKMYKTNKRIKEQTEVLTFYQDYLESKSRDNYFKEEYDNLYKLCETKTNFYLFISDNQAFILIKNNIKDVDEFREFMKSKVKYKRY